MPYTVDTLPANIKKLPAKKRRQWMHVFNSAYKRATGDKEAAAFAQANGVVLKQKEEPGNIINIHNSGTLIDPPSFVVPELTVKYGAPVARTAEQPQAYVPYTAQEHQIDQDAAGYSALGGNDKSACANCQWMITPDACLLVEGVISPTGLSKLWMLEEADEQPAMPVEVVNIDEMATAMASNAEATKTEIAPPTPKPLPPTPPNKLDSIIPRIKSTVSLAEIATEPAPKPTGLINNIKAMFKGDNGTDAPKTLMLYKVKGSDGIEHLRFFTTWTNAFRDDGKDLIPTSAHREMVKWADSDPTHMPELIFWHVIGTEFGKVDWLEFDGLLVHASGPIYDDDWSQQLAISLASMPDPGMSHGSIYSVKESGDIVNYWPFEISAIPDRRYSRNKMTTWSLQWWEEEMAFSDAKKVALKEVAHLDDAQIELLDQRTDAFKKAALAHNIEWKADGDDDVPDTGDLIAAVTTLATAVTTMNESLTSLTADTKEAKDTATAALVIANKSKDDIVAEALTPPAAQQAIGYVASNAEDNKNNTPGGQDTEEAKKTKEWAGNFFGTVFGVDPQTAQASGK
jgi:hypothetical protein